MNLITNLRNERKKRKLTLEMIAAKTGYHKNSIQTWETFKISPSIQAIIDYANALDFDVVLKRKEE